MSSITVLILIITSATVASSVLLSIIHASIAGLLLAMAGGVIVFAGLWIEKEADEDKEKYPLAFSRAEKLVKLRSEIGWWVLMVGICIEIADAGCTAHEITKTNPINQNISDLTASAYFDVAGKDSPDLVISNRYSWPPIAQMMLGYSNAPLQSILPMLQSGDFMRGVTDGHETRWYSVRFVENGSEAMMIDENNNRTKVRELDNVKFIYLSFRFLPHDSEVEDGKIELVANGTVRFIFRIPKQFPKKQFPNSPEDSPWWIVATNSTESFIKQ